MHDEDQKTDISSIVCRTVSDRNGMQAHAETDTEAASSLSVSEQYVAAMGAGWNLGNSFDGVDTDLKAEDKGETKDIRAYGFR